MISSMTRIFEHPVFGFSFAIPEHWTLATWQNRTVLQGYETRMQTSIDDLPASDDFRNVMIAEEILEQEYGRIRCHIELSVWKDHAFALPTRAKKYPCGELPFKARLGKYGRGGEHAAGQLELSDGLVLHLVVHSDEPAATDDVRAVLNSGKRLLKA
jgi:hypothetical protein